MTGNGIEQAMSEHQRFLLERHGERVTASPQTIARLPRGLRRFWRWRRISELAARCLLGNVRWEAMRAGKVRDAAGRWVPSREAKVA